MRMKIVLAAVILAWFPHVLGAEVVILSRGSVKVGCGGFDKSTPVTITKASRAGASAEIKRLTVALKAIGATYPQTEVVTPGTAYAIAVVQKKVGKCEWETHMWRTSSKGAEAAKDRLKAAIKSEPNVVSYSITDAVALD